jgi:hypothetical protein
VSFSLEENIEMTDTFISMAGGSSEQHRSILLEKGYINEEYIESIIGNIEKNGVYMVLKNGFISCFTQKK